MKTPNMDRSVRDKPVLVRCECRTPVATLAPGERTVARGVPCTEERRVECPSCSRVLTLRIAKADA